MYGNLINNTHLLRLHERGVIRIRPFLEDLLRTVHYPLTPRSIYGPQPDSSRKLLQSFDDNTNPFTLDGNQYIVLEVREQIEVEKGIVGQFIPSSNLIEQGLGLTAGRIEFPFGKNGESVRFGLKNLLDSPNEIRPSQYIAYVQFFDLRGLSTRSFTLSERDLAILAARVSKAKKEHAADGGVFYDDPEDLEYEIHNK